MSLNCKKLGSLLLFLVSVCEINCFLQRVSHDLFFGIVQQDWLYICGEQAYFVMYTESFGVEEIFELFD